MVLTDLPPISSPVLVTTLEPTFVSSYFPGGKAQQWMANDNFGDGKTIIANGKYRITFRSGVPASRGRPNGCQYEEKDYDGDPTSGWPLRTGPGPEHGLLRPHKAIVSTQTTNRGNIDTANIVYIPTATGGPVYASIHGVKPGNLREGESGIRRTVNLWQSTTPTRLAASWEGPTGNTHIVDPLQEPSAEWANNIAQNLGEPNVLDGGCGEASIVYEPDGDKVIIFFESKFWAEPEWNGLSKRHHALGRCEAPASSFGIGLSPTMTWTPEPSAESYVYRPRENGMRPGEVYGKTNGSAVWGTSERVTLRSDVVRFPDGSYHMALIAKKPNTGGGKENRTSGIGHYYSLDQGFTWTADANNPLITWESLGWPDNGQANKLNSPSFLVDEAQGVAYLGYWGSPEPEGMNKPGTGYYFSSFPIEGAGESVTVIDDELVPAIAEMAEELGKTVSVIEKTPTYSRSTGTTTFADTSHTGVKMLGMSPVSTHYVGLGLAKDGDTTALFAAENLPFTVRMGLRVTFGSETWTVTRFSDIHSGDSVAAFKVMLRRA